MTEPVRGDEQQPEGSNPFWLFSLRFYGQPGVPPACLDFQDRAGWDVNLLLFALWAGWDCGVVLDGAGLRRIDGAIAAWRDEVVRPLRQIRRRVKAEDNALYQRLKADELRAEQIQQLRMWRASGLSPVAVPPAQALAAATANLDRLLSGRPVSDDDQRARAVLLAALGKLSGG